MKLINGRALVINGRVKLLNGRVMLVNGRAMLINGLITLSNGRMTLINGHVMLVNGRLMLVNGHVMLLNGRLMLVNGHVMLLSGRLMLVNGHVMLVNGRAKSDSSSAAKELRPVASGLIPVPRFDVKARRPPTHEVVQWNLAEPAGRPGSSLRFDGSPQPRGAAVDFLHTLGGTPV